MKNTVSIFKLRGADDKQFFIDIDDDGNLWLGDYLDLFQNPIEIIPDDTVSGFYLAETYPITIPMTLWIKSVVLEWEGGYESC